MTVTTKDLARICGVSRATVTRALHDAENIKPTTKKMILDKAAELGYQPNLVARTLVKGQSYLIGMVVVEVENLYFPKIIHNAGLCTREAGYLMSICAHLDDKQMEKRLIRMLKGYHADGLILNCINKDLGFERMIQELDIPYVMLGYQSFPNSHTVGIDDYESGYQAGRFVLQKGYRRLGFYAPPFYDADGERNLGHTDRFGGFAQAAREAGLPCTLFCGDEGDAQVLAFLRESGGEKPLILSTGSLFVNPLQKLCKQAGYIAPRDFGIMAYDNIEQYGDYTRPLAMVDNHADVVGRKAAEMLLAMIEGRQVPQHQKVDFEIIDGETL